jgi:hypothetical protein
MSTLNDFFNEQKQKQAGAIQLEVEREAQAKTEVNTFEVASASVMEHVVVPTMHKIANELKAHEVIAALDRRIYWLIYADARHLTSLTIIYNGYQIQFDVFTDLGRNRIVFAFYRQNVGTALTGLSEHCLSHQLTIAETTEQKIEEIFVSYLRSLN